MRTLLVLLVCAFTLTGMVRAYDAEFSEAIGQPGRSFTGTGWEQVASWPGGQNAVAPMRIPGGSGTVTTELSGPSGVRFRAWVYGPVFGNRDQPVDLTVTAPGGISRTIAPVNLSPGNAGLTAFVAPSGGPLTWTSYVHFLTDPVWTAVVDDLEIFDPALPASAGAAMDQPGLTFLSAAPTPWVPTTSETHDGVDALTTGALAEGETSDFQVTAPAAMNVVAFEYKTSGHAASTLSVFTGGGDTHHLWTKSGSGGWSRVELLLPVPGATVRWAYQRNGPENAGAAQVDRLDFSASSAIHDAIDMLSPNFIPVGDPSNAFTRTTEYSTDGSDAAQSGANLSPTGLEASVQGPAVVTWKSRGKTGPASPSVQLDFLEYYYPNDTTEWAHHALWVPAGFHSVRFMTIGSPNNVWLLDQVKVTPWIETVATAPGLVFTQTDAPAWERVAAPPDSVTGGPAFRTGDRTSHFGPPQRRSAELRTTATGTGWLSYRSAVSTAAADAGTLFTPVSSQNHSDGTRDVSMAYPGDGPHELLWDFQGGNAPGLQHATVSDIQWRPGTHPLNYPGPWVISGNAFWSHTGEGIRTWNQSPGVAPSFNSTISTAITGPVTLQFQWQCPGALWAPASEIDCRVDGSRAAVISRYATHDPSLAPAPEVVVPIPAGQHTVSWRFSMTERETNDNTAWVKAFLKNVRLVDPVAQAAEALDTTLPLSAVSGNWALESAAGWRGGDRLALSGGSGSLSVTVAGPKTLKFRLSAAPTNQPQGSSFFRVNGPSGALFEGSFSLTGEFQDTRAVVVAEGEHTITWSAYADADLPGLSPIRWWTDALEAFSPADYAAALNNTWNWTASGEVGYAPIPQTSVTHDGTGAVAFYFNRFITGTDPYNYDLTTTITGPELVTWWQKGRVQVSPDPGGASLADTPDWRRLALKLDPGTHTLTWSSAGDAHAWIDEVKPGTEFDNWLAGHLTEDQFHDPRHFSATADADRDSRPALVEYALQTSPYTASQDRAPVLTRDAADDSLFHFTWRQSSAATGVTFTAEGSSNLTSWTPLAAESTGTDGDDTLMRASFRASGAAPLSLVRLRISEL